MFQKKMKHLRSCKEKKLLGIDSVCLQRFATKRCGRMCIHTYIHTYRENKDEEDQREKRVFDRKRKIISLEVSRQTWEEFVPRGVDWKENVIHARREEEQGWKIVLVDFDNAQDNRPRNNVQNFIDARGIALLHIPGVLLPTGRINKINILGIRGSAPLSFQHLFYIFFSRNFWQCRRPSCFLPCFFIIRILFRWD